MEWSACPWASRFDADAAAFAVSRVTFPRSPPSASSATAKDCQAFARLLERTDVLDPAGGTGIFQMPPARMQLTTGADGLRCLRLSDKVLRWYADCCRTPIANTAADPPGRRRESFLHGRCRRTHPHRRRPAAFPNSSPGGYAGWPGRRRSSTIGRRPRAPCRVCSRGASAPLFDPLRRILVVASSVGGQVSKPQSMVVLWSRHGLQLAHL